jgi:hypothetical protein
MQAGVPKSKRVIRSCAEAKDLAASASFAVMSFRRPEISARFRSSSLTASSISASYFSRSLISRTLQEAFSLSSSTDNLSPIALSSDRKVENLGLPSEESAL